MLDQITARDLAEWMAYERVAGPFDDKWEAELIGQLHELMQAMVHMMGGKCYKKNPYKRPKHVPRPWEMYGFEIEPEESEEEDEAEKLAKQIAEFDRQAFGS